MGHRASALAIFGTGSNVGKSLIAAGLCRLISRTGVRVAPFKAQNMSLNSSVTPEGGEIGRAQALQAEACGIQPHVDMNPILLKPESDRHAQVIVHGTVWQRRDGAAYLRDTQALFEMVRQSYERLASSYDVLVIEGAGSAAEVNLWDRDIVNWRVADLADAPVVLVADIDQGGVFAQLIGTVDLLPDQHRQRLVGCIVNKFRGDLSLFSDGVSFLEARTGIPVLGVVPFLHALRLDEEDSLRGGSPARPFSPETVNVAVILLPKMSNFTDFDALEAEDDVALRYVRTPQEVHGADVVIIPGTKQTLPDLRALRAAGFHEVIEEHVMRGGELIGICGGYQMLGARIDDPQAVESEGSEAGLGYLAVRTVFEACKVTERVQAVPLQYSHATSEVVDGYWIHMGRTTGDVQACFRVLSADHQESSCRYDGALRSDGLVWGTYIHGVFDRPGFRRAWLNEVRTRKSLEPLPRSVSERVSASLRMELDRWADHLAAHLDVPSLFTTLGLTERTTKGAS